MHDMVLCVDDDPITLLLIKMIVAKTAFAKEIITAKSGDEAMSYFENLVVLHNQNYPKVILLDLNMPVMGGWEFLDNFTKKDLPIVFKNTKVFILSSSIDPLDIEKAKTYPIVIDFISKPITKEKLQQLMQTLD
jgi:CheY-like chemotaxis protein